MGKSLAKTEVGTWGMLAHLSALIGVLGFGWDILFFGLVLGPLAVWLTKGKLNNAVSANAKAALNFQITVLIVVFALVMLSVVLSLFQVLAMLVLLVGLGFAVYGGLQAKNGKVYNYPFSLRLVK